MVLPRLREYQEIFFALAFDGKLWNGLCFKET